MRSAKRYFFPNFSNWAITHSLMQGMTLPNKQSMDALNMSNLFCMEKLMKLVSSSRW